MAIPGLNELAGGVFFYDVPEISSARVGFVVGDDGVVVIDAGGSAAGAEAVRSAIAATTSLPVRYVINTHHHGDHSFGNWSHLPAVIIGHDRCRVQLVGDAGQTHLEVMKSWMPAAREQFESVVVEPPVLTFAERMRLQLGEHSLRLDFLGRAHTDNDIVVAAEGQDVCFAGDLVGVYAFDSYPAEWAQTLRNLAALPESIYAGGHDDPIGPDAIESQAQTFDELVALCVGAGSAELAASSVSDDLRIALGDHTEVAIRRYFETVA